MSLRKATVRKEGDKWITEYESDAVPAIQGKSTKKHPEIKVDIGMKLEPMKVTYPADQYSLKDVVEATKGRLDTDECEMCEREQKVVAAFVGGLYEIKEQRERLQKEKAAAAPPTVPEVEEETRPLFPFFPRPSIIAGVFKDLNKGG